MEILLTKTPHSTKIHSTVFLRDKMGYYTNASELKNIDTSFFSRMSLTNASELTHHPKSSSTYVVSL